MEDDFKHSPDCAMEDLDFARYGGERLAQQFRCCKAAEKSRTELEQGIQRIQRAARDRPEAEQQH